MDVTLRPVGPDEFDAFRAATAFALGFEPRAEDAAVLREYFEFDRTVAALVGGRIAGTLGAFSLNVTVPGGGALPMCGTTFVGVLPTHRRRGLLRAMMEAHFADIRRRGEPLAGLWSAEAPIYGRFGFGVAAYQNEQVIARDHVQFRGAGLRGPEPAGTVRLVDAEEAARLLPALYDRVRGDVPGMLGRSAMWWNRRLFYDPPHRRGDALALAFAVYEDAGAVQGALTYRRVGRPFGATLARVVISALTTARDDAYQALWRYVAGVDLIGEIEASNRPVDDPLAWLLEDRRKLRQIVRDALWIRVMDVAAALAGRRYAAAGKLVLRVEDAQCPWNDGTFALDGGPDGAACAPTRASPDIVLPVESLGALYLGGNRFQVLARAGRLSGTGDALARADAMFVWPRAPWCPEIF
jgi:predicted acetyltransferase